MSKLQLHEVVLPMDRWSARAVSPINIRKEIDTTAYGKVVLVHPGWGKAPERHAKLLTALADSGFLPVGVDTRYAYADRRQTKRRTLTQSRVVSDANPYFAVNGRSENRWEYRRPTVLRRMCEVLGINEYSLVGHSEGGRISTLAALTAPQLTDKLIIVNGAGMGTSGNGPKRLVRSNIHNARTLISQPENVPIAVRSALGSTAYALLHLRRTWAEKQVIQSTDTWAAIDQLKDRNVAVSVLHAENDELISFQDSAERSQSRPWVQFIPTPGNHSNVYEQAVRDIIIDTLQANSL